MRSSRSGRIWSKHERTEPNKCDVRKWVPLLECNRKRGCNLPTPFHINTFPFLVGCPITKRRFCKSFCLIVFFPAGWTLDMSVTLGRYKAGLPQWPHLLLLISSTGWTTHMHFPRGQGNRLQEFSSETKEIRRVALMCFLCLGSWGRVSALKPYCWKSCRVTSCDCLQRVGGRGQGALKGEPGQRWAEGRKTVLSERTMCAAALDQYCGSPFWVSTTARSLRLDKDGTNHTFVWNQKICFTFFSLCQITVSGSGQC